MKRLALVVQRLDNAITIQRISVEKTNHAIHWIVIYPVDSVIHFSKNRDLKSKFATFNLGVYTTQVNSTFCAR